jgi:hypothetical protein
MSKERELLVRARDVLRGLKETHYDLYWDIQELLDKPEQEERELLRRISSHSESRIPAHFIYELKELLAQPEHIVDVTDMVEPVAWMYEWYENDLESTQVTGGSEKPFEGEIVQPFNIRPLYTAPQKREPFGPEERQRLSRAYSTQAEQVAFEEGIIFAEISYGIGGE